MGLIEKIIKKTKKTQTGTEGEPKQTPVEELIERALSHYLEEDYVQAEACEEELIRVLEQANPQDLRDEDRSLILEYLNFLLTVISYRRDSGVFTGNGARLCSDLRDEGMVSRHFQGNWSVPYVNAILLLCVRIRRMDTYRAIYQRFVTAYDDYDKASIITALLMEERGSVDLQSEVRPLLDRFPKPYYALSGEDKKAAEYAKDIINISDYVSCPISGIEEIVSEEIKRYNGNSSPNALLDLLKCVLRQDRCIGMIRAFAEEHREDPELSDNKKFRDLVQMLQEIATGELQRRFSDPKKEGTVAFINEAVRSKEKTIKELLDLGLSTEEAGRKRYLQAKNTKLRIKRLRNLYRIKFRIRAFQLWASYDAALKLVPSVSTSDVVYMFAGDWNPTNGAVALPLLLEAKKRGYQCISLGAVNFDYDYPDDESGLRDLAGSTFLGKLTDKFDSGRLLNKWEIDIPGKSITVDGMNYYEPIYQWISRWQYSCFYNYDTNAWARSETYKMIHLIDRLVTQCKQIQKWAAQHNKTVRIVSTAPHIPRYAPFAVFCETIGSQYNIEYIYVRTGYDDYFSAGSKSSATLCAMNMTKHPDKRLPIYGTDEGFADYYERNRDRIAEMRTRALEWFSKQRSEEYSPGNKEDELKREEILERIRTHKKQGKKVYLLNGKLIFDMAVKYTKGCAHSDISDWVTHVVRVVNTESDVLLLLKPHPHETRHDVTLSEESIVTFRDIIGTELGDNVIYLEGHLFRNIDLMEYVDVGLTWNSTSTLEMAAMGIKTVMADVWGYMDFPIGLLRFNSPGDYESFLRHPDDYEQDPEVPDKAVAFLNYMSSSDINIRNPYSVASTSNYRQFGAFVDMDEIKRYAEEGDGALEDLFNQSF